MKIERFEAPSMAEAVAQMRRVLGPDAVLLHTGFVKRGGVLGLFGQKLVEVLATTDVQVISRGRPATPGQSVGGSRVIAFAPNGEFGTSAFHSEKLRTAVASPQFQIVERLEQRLDQMQSSLGRILRQQDAANLPDDVSPKLLAVYNQLLQGEVAEELARALVRRLHTDLRTGRLDDPERLNDRLRAYLARLVGPGVPIALRPNETARIVFVGPTGTGKTTTIAKIACQFKFREGCRVGLLTCDTFRIAAVDQLQKYARLLNVPCRVAYTPDEVRRARDEFAGFDLLLMDTMGRSHRSDEHLQELKCFVDAFEPHETHLLISMTGRPGNLAAVVRRFDLLNVNRVIFSKADESPSFGLILSIVAGLGKSLSYVTTGQGVPDDIEVGQPDRVARLILGEEAA